MDKRASRRNHARRGMSKHLIFVYGTLKRGWGNNAIIHDQKYIGVGTTSPDFEMFSLGGYPGVIEGDKRISGELWEIDDAAFARCDRLEGHPNFYKRWQEIGRASCRERVCQYV